MAQTRRRDHDELSSVNLVAPAIVGHRQQIAVSDLRLRLEHGRHRITGGPAPPNR